jgi:hypothetical protein
MEDMQGLSRQNPRVSLFFFIMPYRYRFWAQYHGDEGDNDSVDNFLAGDNSGANNPYLVKVGKAAGGIGGSQTAAVRRARVDKAAAVLGGGASARGGVARAVGGGELPAEESGGGVAPAGGGGGVHLRNKGRSATVAALGGGNGVKVAVQRALAGVGNNITAPAVRLGRRAGQPSPHGRSALEDIVVEQRAELKKDYSFDLPVNQYNGPGAPGYGTRARAAEAWGDVSTSAAVRPPLPAPPALPAGLNERLAKLKLKLARKAEEVDSGSALARDASGGGGSGTEVTDIPRNSAGSHAASARPSSEEVRGTGGRREPGDVLDRLSSVSSAAAVESSVGIHRRVSGTGS